MRRFVTALCAMMSCVAGVAMSAPAAYVLEPDNSIVAFETDFGKDHITGKMPIIAADLILDFDTVANCNVAVSLDASGAEASFPFAAQAMKGPKVLDTGTYPQITFQSTSVQAAGKGAKVTGWLTIRGVRKSTVFDAQIWRQKGTEVGDLSRLSVRLKGTVLRSSFGATGWNDMVGDQVRLDILARVVRVD